MPATTKGWLRFTGTRGSSDETRHHKPRTASKLPPMGALRQILANLGIILLPAVAVLGSCCGQDQGTGHAATVPVFGLVRDSKGEPAAGATVREVRRTLGGVDEQTARQFGIGTRYRASTTTNSRGKFVLKVQVGGTFGIVAMRGRSEQSLVTAPAAPAGQHTLDLKQVMRIKGRITDVVGRGVEQRELPPYQRIVRSLSTVISAIPGRNALAGFGIIEEVETDAQGRFELAILKHQTCRLSDPWRQCQTFVTEPHTAEFLLRRHVRKVRSHVVHNLTGEPVPTAQLHLNGTTRGVSKNGEFEIYLPDDYDLPITATGFYPSSHSSSHNMSSIGMPEAATVQLVATNGDGKPARDLEVFTGHRTHRGRFRLTLDRYQTDASGKAKLPRLFKGDLWVWAKRDARLVSLAQIPGGIEDIKISVSTKTYAVRGTVRRFDGLPAKHVAVFAGHNLERGGHWPTVSVPAAFTDHAGKFTIPALGKGKVCIAAIAPGQQRALITNVQPKHGKILELQLRKLGGGPKRR